MLLEHGERPDPYLSRAEPAVVGAVHHEDLLGFCVLRHCEHTVEAPFEVAVNPANLHCHASTYAKIFLLSSPVVYTYDRRIQAAKAIPVDDREIELLAQSILRELPTHLKFRTLDDPLNMTRGFTNNWGYTLEKEFRVTNVRGHPVHVSVEVAAESMGDNPTRFYVAGGGAKGYYHPDGRGSPTGYKLFTTLYVLFNSNRTPQELLDNLHQGVHKELLSVLRHEVTHLKDLIRPRDDSKLTTPDDPSAYYNEPAEVRAFMRQITDEVIEFAHEVGKDDPFFLYLDTKFVQRALEKSKTWDRISPALNDRNERLILKAVSTALRDEWPKLMKLYPLEDD